MIVNNLRPYVPRRQNRIKPDGTRTNLPPAHVCLRVPIVLIANAVQRATGHSEYTRKIAPHSTAGTPEALILGATGFYETLCRSGPGYFDVHDHDGNSITSIAKVTRPVENKRAVIGAFLDLDKIDDICSKHGIVFADR